MGATLEVWLEEVPFALRLTKQVFTNDDLSQEVLYLVTSDMTLPFDRIQQFYQRRWSVEEYHKSLKQNISLERSPTRTATTDSPLWWQFPFMLLVQTFTMFVHQA